MKEGVFHLIYFTFLHNAQVIAYAILAIVALIFLLKKPARKYVYFFVGWLVLILLFEYEKHIVKDLAEQTVNTMFITDGHFKLQWLVETALYHLAPMIMWAIGWGSILLGMWPTEVRLPKWRRKKKDDPKQIEGT